MCKLYFISVFIEISRFQFYYQGGPLVALNLKGDLNGLVGIVSFGDLISGAQGFTRIASYYDWIQKTTGIKTCLE